MLITETTKTAGKRMAGVVTDLLFPRRCPVCGNIVLPEGALICPGCVMKLSPVRQPSCKTCGKEVFADHMEFCPDCLRHRRSFTSGAALLNYNEAARDSMAAIKYKNKREYLDFYAAVMGKRFAALVSCWKGVERDSETGSGSIVMVPVPVHPSRKRRRGFNQAEELAVRLAPLWGIPVDTGLLQRDKKTSPQRDLNPAERLKNLQQAFSVCPGRRTDTIPHKVILIDDIYTTGSTVEACSRTLLAAGVKTVHFLAVCIGNAC